MSGSPSTTRAPRDSPSFASSVPGSVMITRSWASRPLANAWASSVWVSTVPPDFDDAITVAPRKSWAATVSGLEVSSTVS